MLSPQSVIDDCKPAHFLTKKLASIYKFIAGKLHNTSFVSITKRKLCKSCRTAVQYIAKFCVLPGDLSSVLTIFF